MKILVTGASGYLGRYVLSMLQGLGHEVHAVSTQTHVSQEGVTWQDSDLTEPGQVERLMAQVRPDVLIHLAWYAKHGRFWEARENLSWAEVTSKLLECFGREGGRRAVFAGTCAEYDWSYGYCVEGVTPTAPATLYGKCKDTARHFCQIHCEAHGISYAWARIFFPYGPGEPSGKLIPSVLGALRAGEVVQCTHGRQIRDYIHITDVASALVHLAIETNTSGAFNICSGMPIRLSKIVELCATHFPGSLPIHFGAIETSINEPIMVAGSVERLAEIGWTPRVSIESGIAKYAEVYLHDIVRSIGDSTRA